MFLAVLAVVVSGAWAFPTNAQAHGTGLRWLSGEEPAMAVYFHYSTGEPMAWDKIKVYGPGDEKTEFVIARTDRNGKFAFLPDRPGHWRVEASDDEGHKAVAEAEYQPMSQTPANPSGVLPQESTQVTAQASLWMRAVFGVSLIFNVSMGLALMRRKMGRS